MKNFCKTQRLELQLAKGLDSIIESKDREQNLETLLTLKLINGGYKEKYWSFEEKRIEECTQETTYKESKDSKATQENKHKQILEIYFSYGEGCKRVKLKDIEQNSWAKYSQNVNLHIRTQGYENGERLDIALEFQQETFQTYAPYTIIKLQL